MPAAAKTATAATSRRFLWIIPLLLLVAAVIGNVLRARADAAAVLRADPGAILADPRLRKIALDAGRQVFVQHCAACHGTAGKGDQQIGAPDLTDDDHLYGTGTVSQIEDIARYGIRAGNKRGWNLAVMPAYARRIPDAAEPLPPQTPAQIDTLVAFLHSFTAGVSDPTLVQRGRALYLKAGCWDCHGRDMGGDPAIARTMHSGTVSGPIPAPDGIHILQMVTNKPPVETAYPDARDRVMRDFLADKVGRLQEGNKRFLRKRADIKIASDLQ
jgi:cytochrome c oxidase cbb3-type subunit 3